MSERDPEPRAQGTSPYDEPTGTFRVPRDLAAGGAASGHDDERDSGVAGFAPYRPADPGPADRDRATDPDGADRDRADRDRADEPDRSVASTVASPAVSADEAPTRSATARSGGAQRTTAIDRDAFHREHHRRAALDTVAYSERDLGVDEDLPAAGGDDDLAVDRSEDATEKIAAPGDRRRARRGERRDRERGRVDEDELAAAHAAARRGTTDLGLLVLRVAVGLVMMAHGAQKLFGWWGGPRLSGFEQFLANTPNPAIGFRPDATTALAVVGALSESIGGLMLVLGLLTPIAGAAVLGVMIVAATYKATLAGGVWFFATGQAGPGIEYEIVLGVAAAVIVLAGPGRISLDFARGWATRPFIGSVAWLVVGIAAPVAVWILLNGTNPFQSPGNPVSN